MDVLSWDNAPPMLDAKQAALLLTLKPVWVRRNLRHLAVRLGPRLLRFPKDALKAWAEGREEMGV